MKKNKELEKFEKIEQEIEENEKKLLDTKKSYNEYIKNIEIAKREQEIKTELTLGLNEIKEIEEKSKNYKINLENLKKEFNEEEFKNTEEKINQLIVKITEINTRLKTNNDRLELLKKQVNELKEVKEEANKLSKKIKTYEKIIEYLTKIRKIIKEAPEEISKILIKEVSKKATEIYSKIANDNTILEWKEGYEVVLIDSIEGNQIEKEFRQLSGGEQMSAALAIRISMLEILTNLKIGILDEPTVNMDTGRRQRLAEIIEEIGGLFIQLFIVSHDDTFNSVTENTIQL